MLYALTTLGCWAPPPHLIQRVKVLQDDIRLGAEGGGLLGPEQGHRATQLRAASNAQSTCVELGSPDIDMCRDVYGVCNGTGMWIAVLYCVLNASNTAYRLGRLLICKATLLVSCLDKGGDQG
jgi:hypothetical protein